MAQRRAQPQTTKPRKTAAAADDFDFLASQQSTGSDDHAFQLAVAQQLMATKDKKRQEKEKKFMVAARAKLEAGIRDAADDVKNAIATTEEVYAKFVFDYAAAEDAIRALWTDVIRDVQTLENLAKRQRAVRVQFRKEHESPQYAGLGRVKEASREISELVCGLTDESE